MMHSFVVVTIHLNQKEKELNIRIQEEGQLLGFQNPELQNASGSSGYEQEASRGKN